jgi:hypothetical protein
MTHHPGTEPSVSEQARPNMNVDDIIANDAQRALSSASLGALLLRLT